MKKKCLKSSIYRKRGSSLWKRFFKKPEEVSYWIWTQKNGRIYYLTLWIFSLSSIFNERPSINHALRNPAKNFRPMKISSIGREAFVYKNIFFQNFWKSIQRNLDPKNCWNYFSSPLNFHFFFNFQRKAAYKSRYNYPRKKRINI